MTNAKKSYDDLRRRRFTCPVCGSHYFNTSGPPGLGLTAPVEQWEGRCKGLALDDKYKRGYTGCNFTWSRADDDRYFMDEDS
jgi:hypothetical protein